MRLGDGESAKAKPPSWLDLSHTADVEGAHRRDFRIPSRGLPVYQQHDGPPVADHLDAPERNAVGNDVVAATVLDERAAQPRAHSIALRQHLVGTVEKSRDAARREPTVLWPQHHADLRFAGIVRYAVAPHRAKP